MRSLMRKRNESGSGNAIVGDCNRGLISRVLKERERERAIRDRRRPFNNLVWFGNSCISSNSCFAYLKFDLGELDEFRENYVDLTNVLLWIKRGLKMNHCNLQQNASMSRDESRGFVLVSCDLISSVVCPKPRRVRILSDNIIRPFRLHSRFSSQSGAADACDSKVGATLLDIILRKEETLADVASSSPFFLRFPPSRASNPLAHDTQFGDEKLKPISPLLSPLLPSPSSSRVKGGGCGRVKFGIKSAAV